MIKSQSIVIDQDHLRDVTYKSESRIKQVNQYVLGERLGEGSFGKVREAIDSNTLKRVAIKIINKRTLKKLKNGEETLKNEIAIMKQLRNHENVLKLIEVIHNEEKQKIYVVLEFCGAGSLQQLIDSHPNSRLPLVDVHHFFRQLILGLDYIHNQGIIHRDIKPANLMVTPDRVLKVADFGVARKLDKFSKSDIVSHAHGSPAFQSPQIATGAKTFSGFKLDIWACGVTLYVLVVGKYPFEDENVFKLYEKIAQAEYDMPDFVEDDLKDLIRGMLDKNEDTRYSIQQIRDHPWFNTTRYEEKGAKPSQLVDRWRSTSLLPFIAKAVGDFAGSGSGSTGGDSGSASSSPFMGSMGSGGEPQPMSIDMMPMSPEFGGSAQSMQERQRSTSSPMPFHNFPYTSRRSISSSSPANSARQSTDVMDRQMQYKRDGSQQCTIL